MTFRSYLRPLAWLLITFCVAMPAAFASDDTFVVEDIDVHGLQRITEGTLFNYLPVSIGDQLTPERTAQALRALFATGFFRDVELRRDGNTLVIAVLERPTIAQFTVTGNKDIKDEDMRGVLRQVGLAEGRIFDRAVLEDVRDELRRQYFNRGKYAVRIDTDVTEREGNMVTVAITIAEGQVSRIRSINFTGNETFGDRTLMREMELSTTNWLSWFRKDDQYSREQLQGDLESVSSFYMDQGYANFEIDSVQVAISPDKRDIYVTVNLTEGDLYTIGTVRLAGNLIVDEEELQPLILFRTGDSFNRRAITVSGDFISRRLGEEGYANAEVLPLPELDHETNTVDVLLYVEPGNRVYVRRINFAGSERTNDETYRREMRQLEGGWLQGTAIERSKVRLQRLAFVEDVEIETNPVPGTDDLVDVDIDISERAPGNFQVGLGYSGAFGIMLNAGITHSNFLGEGKRIQLDLNRSRFSEHYQISMTDPYWTVDGISRTYGLFYRSADQLFARSSPLFINSHGGNLSFGIPLTEYSHFSVGATVQDTELVASVTSSPRVRRWMENPNHGRTEVRFDPQFPLATLWRAQFRTLELTGGYTHDTRNRVIFADRGSLRQVSFEWAVPPGDVTYLMSTVRNQTYLPLGRNRALVVRGEVSAGKSLGDTHGIPPFKNLFGGGPTSVRGFRENWLGPRDLFDFPEGGNIRMHGQLELQLPPPIERVRNNTRINVFFDAGNVFQGRHTVELDALRMSVGVGVTWLAPLGAMSFSLAYPLNNKPGDEVERFQFTLGTAF